MSSISFLSHLCGGKFAIEEESTASRFLSHLCGGKFIAE
ncbi:hypothetical protein [uncultured Gammaproteobacteria bacterium]|nr:hypothetical protein [uncultured Gammaproteobacteria bacterium]